MLPLKRGVRFKQIAPWVGLNTIIQIEGAITLQLEARQITNPADQLRVVRHVALSYRNLLETPFAPDRQSDSTDGPRS
jgi:hypothetical protein